MDMEIKLYPKCTHIGSTVWCGCASVLHTHCSCSTLMARVHSYAYQYWSLFLVLFIQFSLMCASEKHLQTLGVLKNNSCTVIAMGTAYYSPYSKCIGYQLTTSSHIVYCINNTCRYAAIPSAHALAHAHYFSAHKMADRRKPYRSGRCCISATKPFQKKYKLILVTRWVGGIVCGPNKSS